MKNKNKYRLLAISFCLLAITLFSCKKKEYAPIYFGYDYFPNTLGHYTVYECDSIIYNPYSAHKPQFDTTKYQIREVIDSIYTDNEGRPTMRVVRYRRPDSLTKTVPWSNILIPEKVWKANLLSNMAWRQEDNYEYVKLVFPMSLNEMWNGNSVNSLSAVNYQYTTLHTPYTLKINNSTGTVHFDSTLTVAQQKDSGLDFYQYYFEQYAAGYGLIHKVVIDYAVSYLSTIPPKVDSANSGTIFYSETYLSSGNQ